MSDNETISRIQIELVGDQQAAQGMARLQTQADAANKAFSTMDRASRQAAESVANIKLSGAAANEAKKLATGLDEIKKKGKEAGDILAKTSTGGKGRELLSNAAALLPGVGGDVVQVISQLQGATDAIGKMGVSAGQIAIAGPLAVGALAAMGIAINLVTSQVQKAAEAMRAAMSVQGDIMRILVTGTSEDAKNRIEQAQIDLKVAELTRARAEASIAQLGGMEAAQRATALPFGLGQGAADLITAYNQANNAMTGQTTIITSLTGALERGEFAANDTKVAEEQLAEERKKAAKAALEDNIHFWDQRIKNDLDSYDLINSASSKSVEDRIARNNLEMETTKTAMVSVGGDTKIYTDRLKDLDAENRRLTSAVLPFIKMRENEAAATKQAEQAIKDFTGEMASLADLDKTRAATVAEQAEQDARDAQVSALEAKIAQSKERDEQAVHQDKMADQRKEAAQKERELGAQFMAESLKSLKAFQLSESRQTGAYNLQRERQMEDLYADLTALASNRDVAGFITRQRQGNIDLKRGAQDFGISAGQRAEDFGIANEERRAQFEQQRDEQRAQAQAQIETERQVGQQRVTETAKLEQQLATLRAQWAEADKQAQRAQEQQAYNERRTQLSNAIALETALIRGHYAIEINQVKNFVQGAQAWIGSLVSYVQRGAAIYTDQIARPGRPVLTANAEGGIYDRPTVGMLGERPGWSDFVFPVKRGEGIGPALNRALGGRAGGNQITINDNRTVIAGDLASRADIKAELDADRRELFEGLRLAVAGASGI